MTGPRGVTCWHTFLVEPYIVSLHGEHLVDIFGDGSVALFSIGNVAVVRGLDTHHTHDRLWDRVHVI